ncbi:TPA: response regulator [Candidatus Bathyarchaeota archaeon]|nr:response regulator [Candidatus Bathyarchaeota archaeon]
MKKTDHILLVDDDDVLTEFLGVLLRGKGYEVTVVKSGKGALRKLKDNFYAVILIDIKLPDIDGIELISKMPRAEPDMRKGVLTGNPSFDNVQKALKAGAHDYLVKPAKLDEIVKTIEDQIKIQQTELKARYKTISLPANF